MSQRTTDKRGWLLDGRVMIVDDQAPFRDGGTGRVRAGVGFELVAEAESGEDAVDRSTMIPRLVLMDINMGGISGIEATARSPRRTRKSRCPALDVQRRGPAARRRANAVPPPTSTKRSLGGRALRKVGAGGEHGWRVRYGDAAP